MTRDDALTMARKVTGLTLVSNGRKMTDAQIVVMCQAAYQRALEDAAWVCERVNNHDNPMTATDCADAIRALGMKA